MKKILAIGASNSSTSINKVFATYVANKIEDATVTVADLNELELPLYSTQLEAEIGIPENAVKFRTFIEESDGIVLSLAEYNGMITSAFKNLWDWASRVDMKIWKEKPMLLLSTSPGGRGGIGALELTKNILPYFEGNVIAEFSLPTFYDNFKDGAIVNEELASGLATKIEIFQKEV